MNKKIIILFSIMTCSALSDSNNNALPTNNNIAADLQVIQQPHTLEQPTLNREPQNKQDPALSTNQFFIPMLITCALGIFFALLSNEEHQHNAEQLILFGSTLVLGTASSIHEVKKCPFKKNNNHLPQDSPLAKKN